MRRCTPLNQVFSGPETGERKRVTRKADRKLTLFVNLGESWQEKLTLLVTHFSLPISAYSFQGHSSNPSFIQVVTTLKHRSTVPAL